MTASRGVGRGRAQRKPKEPCPTGTRVGRLVTTDLPYPHPDKGYLVSAECDCGTKTVVIVRNMLTGHTTSCGCSRKRSGTEAWAYQEGAATDKLAWVRAEKNVPCTDCGSEYPDYCMDFDHVPGRGPKLYEVNYHTAKRKDVSLEALKTERVKCDLVCAICHRKRTHQRHRRIVEGFLGGRQD